MALKKTFKTEEEIPAEVREHYTEAADGSFVLDVEGGFKTEADVLRLKGSLDAEREAHKATKKKIQAFGDLTAEGLQEMRDRNEELEAQVAAGAAPKPEQLEPLIQARVKREVLPVTKERDQLKAERDEAVAERDNLRKERRTARLKDALAAASAGEKGVKLRSPAVIEDAMFRADRVFEETEEGDFVTKDGEKPADWLRGLQAAGTVPHWFAESEGAGATGGKGGRGGAGPNPLKQEKPNITEWSKLFRTNQALAIRYAKEAKRLDLLPANLRSTAAA